MLRKPPKITKWRCFSWTSMKQSPTEPEIVEVKLRLIEEFLKLGEFPILDTFTISTEENYLSKYYTHTADLKAAPVIKRGVLK